MLGKISTRATTHSHEIFKGDGNSSMEEISDISGISGEMDYLNPNATSNCPKRRRSTAITEKFGAFLSPWGKRSHPEKSLKHSLTICNQLSDICIQIRNVFSENLVTFIP